MGPKDGFVFSVQGPPVGWVFFRAEKLPSYMDVSKNRGVSPQIIHFNRVFHYFHHPFWATPIFGNTHIGIIMNYYKDPYYPTSISWNVMLGFGSRCSSGPSTPSRAHLRQSKRVTGSEVEEEEIVQHLSNVNQTPT